MLIFPYIQTKNTFYLHQNYLHNIFRIYWYIFRPINLQKNSYKCILSIDNVIKYYVMQNIIFLEVQKWKVE